MRSAFVETITQLAEQDHRIMLLTGDLGFMALEPFIEKFPDRFINVGVAEQNMMGLSVGLAEAGYIPFAYSIVTFAVLRPYEFIRNGAILHQLPVRIVGVGGGVEYGHAGPTHHGLEDISVMRTQPGITVIAPADPDQTVSAIRSTWDLPGPVYYRLGKNDKAFVAGLHGTFALGHIQIIRNGRDLLFIAMGAIACEVLQAAEILASTGISCTVVVVASINPAPVADLVELLGDFNSVLTVEAHYITGGLGSMIAEIIADHGLGNKLVRCGIRQTPAGLGGSQAYLLDQYGISSERLVEIAQKTLNVS